VPGGVVVARRAPLFITLISAVLLAFILEPLVQLLMRLRIRRGFAVSSPVR